MPGAWTTLLVKPPVSVTVVTPEVDPDAIVCPTSRVTIDPLLDPMLVDPVGKLGVGRVGVLVVGVPDGKWVEINLVPSGRTNDFRGTFFEGDAVGPTEGPTGVPPEGPRAILPPLTP